MPKTPKQYIIKCLTTSDPRSFIGLSDWGVKYRPINSQGDCQKVWESYVLDYDDGDKSIQRWSDINAAHFQANEWTIQANEWTKQTRQNSGMSDVVDYWYEVSELTDDFGRRRSWLDRAAEEIRLEEDRRVLEVLDQSIEDIPASNLRLAGDRLVEALDKEAQDQAFNKATQAVDKAVAKLGGFVKYGR